MTTIERDLPIDVDRLFAILVDPETYPAWLVGAKRIREVAPSWPAVGADFRHVVGFGPMEIPDRTTLVSIDPPTLLVLHVRARPVIEAEVRFEITAAPIGCHLTMTETPVGIHRVITAIASPMVRARNVRSIDRLEALVRRHITPD